LNERGLRAALGAIVARCNEQRLWPQLRELIARGHEIVNHSHTHANQRLTPDYEQEIAVPKAELEAALGVPNSFYVFPFDEFTPEAVAYLKRLDFLGARTGGRGITPPDHADDFAINFDVYGPDWSIYVDDPVKRNDILNVYVDDAIADGGWAVREVHGVEDASWESVPLDEYVRHLDYVKGLVDSGALWMDTPTTIIDYRRARDACGEPRVTADLVEFTGAESSCPIHATPLSVVISTELDAETLVAWQGDRPLSWRKLAARRFAIDVQPLGAPARIQKGE
jgi:hypothetical protein